MREENLIFLERKMKEQMKNTIIIIIIIIIFPLTPHSSATLTHFFQVCEREI